MPETSSQPGTLPELGHEALRQAVFASHIAEIRKTHDEFAAEVVRMHDALPALVDRMEEIKAFDLSDETIKHGVETLSETVLVCF